MNSDNKKIYQNVSRNGKEFILESRDGIRDYRQRSYIDPSVAETINENDKLLLITAERYPYTTEDLGEMIYQLLNNKLLPSARQAEADKLYHHIRRALLTPNRSGYVNPFNQEYGP